MHSALLQTEDLSIHCNTEKDKQNKSNHHTAGED